MKSKRDCFIACIKYLILLSRELKNLRIIIDEQHRKIQMKLESDIERRGRVEGEWIEIIQKAA